MCHRGEVQREKISRGGERTWGRETKSVEFESWVMTHLERTFRFDKRSLRDQVCVTVFGSRRNIAGRVH